MYRVGDRIAGAAITHIEARRLILLRNGAREALTLETAEPRRGRFDATDERVIAPVPITGIQ